MAENFVNVTEGSGKKLHTFNRTIGANDVHDEGVFLAEQYLASYGVSQTTAISTATANSHLLQIMAGASLKVRVRRIEIHQQTLATGAALADIAIYRLTTAGTGGTAFTPAPLDPADAASGATSMTLPTVKGTEAAQIYRAAAPFTQTITATPAMSNPVWVWDADIKGKPIVIAAGTSNGIAVKVIPAVAGATVWVNSWIDESSF